MLDADTALVTAPFIRIVWHNKKEYFTRADSADRKKILIAATESSRRVIEFFRSGRARSELTVTVMEEPATDELIDQLMEHRLLLRMDSLQIRAPSIELEITNRCNAKCVMCPREDLRALGDMPEPVFRRCMELIESVPVSGVILQGIGEPTLHKQLESWTKELSSVLRKRPLVMVTNGIGLNADRLGRLRQAGLGHVQWSFHSRDPDVYNSIMGTKSFDKANRNFINCAREHGDMLSVNFVAMESNSCELNSFREWLEELGLPSSRLRVIPCFSRGGFVNTSALTGRFQELQAGRCLYVKKSLFVAWNGDLLPCSNDIRGDEVLANVLVIDGVDALEQWRDELLVPPLHFDICKQCDHFIRDTVSTDWFTHIKDASIRGLSVSKQDSL